MIEKDNKASIKRTIIREVLFSRSANIFHAKVFLIVWLTITNDALSIVLKWISEIHEPGLAVVVPREWYVDQRILLTLLLPYTYLYIYPTSVWTWWVRVLCLLLSIFVWWALQIRKVVRIVLCKIRTMFCDLRNHKNSVQLPQKLFFYKILFSWLIPRWNRWIICNNN